MYPLYQAHHALQAQMLADLLGQDGIRTFVQGAYLQGAAGLLPPTGLVQIFVLDHDPATLHRARQLVAQWESCAFQLPAGFAGGEGPAIGGWGHPGQPGDGCDTGDAAGSDGGCGGDGGGD